MRGFFTFKFCYFCSMLILNFESGLLGVQQPVFMSHLQSLCPFSTFCHNDNVTLELPNEDVIPCCDSCSCQPDCYLNDTCCYNNLIPSTWNVLKKCMSSVVSNTVQEKASIHYNMIVSCSNGGLTQGQDGSEVTLCEYNQSDYTSFAPVTSQQTGDIYVNSQCAHCNNVYDLIYWKLSISRPHFKDDHSYDTTRLLQGIDIGPNACYLTYIPDDDIELDKRMCDHREVIRQCNVTGKAMTWKPYWDFCPMFNATYRGNMYYFYGNVFCYLCNQRDTEEKEERLWKTCSRSGGKNPFGVSLTIVLDTSLLQFFDEPNVEHLQRQYGECEVNEVLIQKTCRPILCPWGQFRVASKCGYYSSRWTGGPFIAVLKLTPRDRSKLFNKSVLMNMPTKVRNDKKAPWLQRNAMKNWDIETLYKQSNDEQHVDYLVAFARYPSSTVNPARLLSIVQRTLKEIWTLSTDKHVLSLDVQLNPNIRYKKLYSDYLSSEFNITIGEDNAYITDETRPTMTKEDMHYVVYSIEIGQSSVQYEYLKEVFLCDQIELLQDEYDLEAGYRNRLLIKATNRTLSESNFWINEDGYPVTCLKKVFYQNNGVHIAHRLKYLPLLVVSFPRLMKFIFI